MTITVYTISFKVGPKKKWNRKTHVNNQFYSDPFYRINWFSFTFWHDQIGVRYVNKGIVPITKAATSQMYIFPSRNFLNVHFPKRKLPKCTFFQAATSQMYIFPSGSFLNAHFPRRQLPKCTFAQATTSQMYIFPSVNFPKVRFWGAAGCNGAERCGCRGCRLGNYLWESTRSNTYYIAEMSSLYSTKFQLLHGTHKGFPYKQGNYKDDFHFRMSNSLWYKNVS